LWNGCPQPSQKYFLFIHLDIKDNKIWIQHNGTENEVTEDLVNMGVPKQDIVIGFHSPFKRQFTEYAVG
jgi:XisI protein